jgi:hypothetical protein
MAHRLCGLVVRVSGYRSKGAGFDFRPVPARRADNRAVIY